MPRAEVSEPAGAEATRLLLVDDHEMVARSLAAAIGAEHGLEVVGTAASVAECLRLAREFVPDVVVMDLGLGDGDGLEATRLLRAMLPEVNVVMLTGNLDERVAEQALKAGCCAFVAKSGRLEQLVAAIRAAESGSTWFPRRAVDRLVHPDDPAARPALSGREREVLELMASGHSTSVIAQELGLSVHTTRNHVRNLMAKLDVHSRLDAVVVAARCGLIKLPDAP